MGGVSVFTLDDLFLYERRFVSHPFTGKGNHDGEQITPFHSVS